jgi:hypothetical protein
MMFAKVLENAGLKAVFMFQKGKKISESGKTRAGYSRMIRFLKIRSIDSIDNQAPAK